MSQEMEEISEAHLSLSLQIRIDSFSLFFISRDLSNNQIQKISVDAFRNLKSLTSL